MISLNSTSTPPAPPAHHDLQAVLSLINIIGDPPAAHERADLLAKASEHFRDDAAKARDALAELDRAKAIHGDGLAKAAAEHDAKLAASQAQFETEWRRRETELATREAAANDLQRQAQAASDEAARIKTDYEARLSRITAAAASPS